MDEQPVSATIGEAIRNMRLSDSVVIADTFKEMKGNGQTHATYCSFARSFWLLKKLGFIDEVPESREPAWNPTLQERRNFRLTPRGRQAPLHLWSNPMRALYNQVHGEGAWEDYMAAYRRAHATGRPRGRPSIIGRQQEQMPEEEEREEEE